MTTKRNQEIIVTGAKAHNLKDISLNIPHHKLIVVTGISGSGKSSLVFDIIAKEGQRRYFETLPSFARQFMGKLNRPDVDQITGLSPVIAIGQSTAGMHVRSTVGTMSDIYDLLRLLYARTGTSTKKIELSRALFSFNSESGKCSACNGIGKEEQIDLNRLIQFPDKTIREGALAPTLPTGYIMYSQVTIDVLNQVCQAEGFHVDISWNDLSDEQQEVILYGSEKIKVPFGKHSLESRLKWTGIKAKPREEGYYKGMIPIMSDILRRDRNANILKYVHSVKCAACDGRRLNQNALSVQVNDKTIADLGALELNGLNTWLKSSKWNSVGQQITKKIIQQIDLLEDLGLGHLSLERSAKSLSSSEIQRIRVANQIAVALSDVIYVFDEPSIGLHFEENKRMIHHFKELVKRGNTVLVVEHDLDTIAAADHVIDIGPKAGVNGGELLFNGSLSDFLNHKGLNGISPTYHAMTSPSDHLHSSSSETGPAILLRGCRERNLKEIDVEFKLGKLNIVSGKSGAGKSSLVRETLLKLVQEHLGQVLEAPPKLTAYENLELIHHHVFIDHSPIGKTPRSNPATYLGLSDHIRDIYANTAAAKSSGYSRSRFSFNTKGGRCETCQGAGKTQIGMHFLGNIDLVCETCNGRRFNEETLQIKYKGLSIADVYKLSVKEAIVFFSDQQKLFNGLRILDEIGLDYLTLGQSSTTLSGGEAQRIKIANQLQKKDTGDTLFIIIEPSIGLHHQNIQSLLDLFGRIKQKGNTIVCVEQNEQIIDWSDWHIALGPEGGKAGGKVIHQGKPKIENKNYEGTPVDHSKSIENQAYNKITLRGVTTHSLKNITVQIPKNELTVVTGVSGSGKSSLVYDTLLAEANARFSESLSVYNRSFIQQNSDAQIASYQGLGPAVGINRKGTNPSKRSTVGTLSGVYDALRLLYSRLAQEEDKPFTAQHYSFNHHLGACSTCKGLGHELNCNPAEIIVDSEHTIFEGAISTNKSVKYYSDLNGQFMATLRQVAKTKEWNLDRPWKALEYDIQNSILYGTGDTLWDVTWDFSTKSRSGTQSLTAKWLGFCQYIDDEYQRKLHNKNIKDLEDLLHPVQCADCHGSRLKNELLTTTFLGKNIHELCQMNIASCLELLTNFDSETNPVVSAIAKTVIPTVSGSLNTIADLGMGYLSLDRPINTLSGGERQRITLSGQLATHLFGVTYVLDEPTIGLDQRQIIVLIDLLRKMITNGNTVVVVEHDPTFIRDADYLIEMGPSAGHLGGEVVFQGPLAELHRFPHSVTHQLLDHAATPRAKGQRSRGKPFGLKGAFANNLKHIDVTFFAGNLTAVTGVSGSGKSSLIKEALFASWKKNQPVGCATLYGLDQFEQVLLIDQSPLAQNRLSTPASYSGLLDRIMALFSKTEDAKEHAYKKADFSYQSKRGKCPRCAGHGKLKTSMDFMSDIWLPCDACKGMRYSPNVLACKLNGYSIGDVLKLTIDEAMECFKTTDITNHLDVLQQLGLGHLQLGQAGNTLSGGESQRLKLATALMQPRKGTTLYLFDEPSTGLHHLDILKLIKVFETIVDDGDTVIFIEHNSLLIEQANELISLGPGSGEQGGALTNI